MTTPKIDWKAFAFLMAWRWSLKKTLKGI